MSEKSCCEEVNDLKEKINNLLLKSEKLKTEYKKLLIVNLEKDVKIRNLKKELEKNKFLEFKVKLSEDCLSELEIIGNSVVEDSTFVSCIIADLYDLSTLKNLTLSGRGETVEISTEKREVLEAVFSRRLAYVPREEVNDFRRNNLSKLIRNAIDNAKRKKAISTKE